MDYEGAVKGIMQTSNNKLRIEAITWLHDNGTVEDIRLLLDQLRYEYDENIKLHIKQAVLSIRGRTGLENPRDYHNFLQRQYRRRSKPLTEEQEEGYRKRDALRRARILAKRREEGR